MKKLLAAALIMLPLLSFTQNDIKDSKSYREAVSIEFYENLNSYRVDNGLDSVITRTSLDSMSRAYSILMLKTGSPSHMDAEGRIVIRLEPIWARSPESFGANIFNLCVNTPATKEQISKETCFTGFDFVYDEYTYVYITYYAICLGK